MRRFKKGSSIAVNHEQSTSSMATARTETTCGLTYSVSRAREVTAWQSVNAICLCCLTDSSCHWTHTHLFWVQRWGLPEVRAKEDGFHLSMPSPHDLQHVLDQPECIML